MKLKIILIFFLYLYCGLAYSQNVNVKIIKDTDTINVSDFSIKSIETVSHEKRFVGIPAQWTLLLEVKYNDTLFQIPINSNVHYVLIHPNKNACGFCNMIYYYGACDAITITEHGNGCYIANQVQLNSCAKGKGDSFSFDGVRNFPHNYVDEANYSRKHKRKKEK